VDLTDLTRVKTLIEQGGGTVASGGQAEGFLSFVIPLVSRQIERRLRRLVEKVERTERYSIETGARYIAVNASPIDDGATLSVWHDLDRVFPASSALNATDFEVTQEGTGLRLLIGLAGGTRVVKLTYTGGMAANLAALEAGSYGDVLLATTLQVVHVYQRRKSFGGTALSAGAGAVTFVKETALLDGVKELLDPLTFKAVA
jgi:hypothetical protein